MAIQKVSKIQAIFVAKQRFRRKLETLVQVRVEIPNPYFNKQDLLVAEQNDELFASEIIPEDLFCLKETTNNTQALGPDISLTQNQGTKNNNSNFIKDSSLLSPARVELLKPQTLIETSKFPHPDLRYSLTRSDSPTSNLNSQIIEDENQSNSGKIVQTMVLVHAIPKDSTPILSQQQCTLVNQINVEQDSDINKKNFPILKDQTIDDNRRDDFASPDSEYVQSPIPHNDSEVFFGKVDPLTPL